MGRSGLRRWAPRAALLFGLAIVTTGRQSNDFTRQGLLAPVTKQGQVIVAMWQDRGSPYGRSGSSYGADPVGVIFHRKRGDQLPGRSATTCRSSCCTQSAVHHGRRLFFFTARNENYVVRTRAIPASSFT